MSTTTAGYARRVGNYLRTPGARGGLLAVPLVVFELFLFIIPMLILVRMSLHRPSPTGAYDPGLTLTSYMELLTSEFIHGIVVYTFKTAVIVTAVTIVISVLYAHAIWRSTGLRRSTLLGAIVLSLLTTLVVKLYAWVILLAPRGTINDTLLALNVLGEPVALMNNEVGVVIGLTYAALPYAVLSIYSVLETINMETFHAAIDLGATRPRAFYEVILPSALPGIIVGAVISFTWSVGAYASPALLGSSKERTFAIEVADLILTDFNWPAGAALSVIVLVVVLVSVVALFYFLNQYEGGVEYVG